MVGGGDSSAQMALSMLDYASGITLVTRNSTLAETMSDYLVRISSRAASRSRTETMVAGVEGNDEPPRSACAIPSLAKKKRCRRAGLLIMSAPNRRPTGYRLKSCATSAGYIVTGGDGRRSLETSMSGVFAVGDVRYGFLKRIAAAVGEG